ncbi:MAG: hypothetical protein ABIN55_10860 [Aeromicrobium sp.]
MRISVIGCGYLGVVHAACMATLGHEVVGLDASFKPNSDDVRDSPALDVSARLNELGHTSW